MKINKEELLKVLDVVYKGVGNNKIIPITQMLGLEVKEGYLVLKSTDSSIYVTGKVKVETDESFNVCVNADLFTKLIGKFSTKEIELLVENDTLVVKGDGDYKLEILPDENGNAYEFKSKEYDSNIVGTQVEAKEFDYLERVGSKSLAVTMETPSLTNYYLGEKLIATDSTVMTIISRKLFDKEVILKSKFVELVTLLEGKVEVGFNETNIQVKNNSFTIVSQLGCPLSDYPSESVLGLVNNLEFTDNALVNTAELKSVLDRLSLFVTQYDDGEVDVKFDSDKLYLSTKKSSGVEVLKLECETPIKSFSCATDINTLIAQLSSFTNEKVKLSYNETFIGLSADDVIKLVANND